MEVGAPAACDRDGVEGSETMRSCSPNRGGEIEASVTETDGVDAVVWADFVGVNGANGPMVVRV